jgi:ribosomal protein L7Ae-like RNA K-turn-binding protein
MESLRPLVHRDIKSFHKQSKRAAAAAAQLSTATPLSTATTTTTSTPITPADPQHQFTRDVFALGINEVTRALEQDGAQLVLVCASIHPPHVVLHLPTLCALRKARVCAIPDLSHHMATLFGLKHVAALAFRRTLLCDQQHHEMLKGVITRMASLMTVPALPWLPTAATSTSSSTTEPTTPTTGVDAITMDRRRKAPDITYLSARVKRMKAEPQSKTPPKPASVKS